MRNKIVIVAGDPNSINSEIIYKSLKKISRNLRRKIIIIGNCDILNDQLKFLNKKLYFNKITNLSVKNIKNGISIIDVPLNYRNCFKVDKLNSAKYVKKCLSIAHNLSSKQIIKGFINCPIDKKLIKTRGVYGVTEYLAKKSKLRKSSEVMMLFNRKLSVVPLTTHIDLKNVSKQINKNLISKKILTINNDYKRLFKITPKIALLGLNPHNLELSAKSEERKIIIPAIKKLKKSYKVKGPFSADSFFINEYKKYNLVVGMYHDQVLIPFKQLFKFDAINVTLGLKYIRVSPDHGTAHDLINKNQANPKSIIECINFLRKIK